MGAQGVIRRPRAALLLVAWGLGLCSGCYTAAGPRSARVAEPGDLTVDVHLPIVTIAPGVVEGALVGEGEGREVRVGGLSGGFWDGTAILAPPLWFAGALHLGMFRPCEAGVLLSPLRGGTELRCQLVDHARVAVAVSSAVQLTFWRDRALWMRAGADFSLHLDGWSVMLGAYVSHGPETHYLEPVDAPEGFSTPPEPDTIADGAAPGAWVTHRETRVTVPLGFGIDTGHGTALVLGLVFHVPVQEGAPTVASCEGCNLEVTSLEERFGLTLTLGFSLR